MKAALALVILGAFALCACEREERAFRSDAVASEEVPSGKGQSFEANAYHVSEGKTLYSWFNCNGCHANGGGGMGPALMDEEWIYGGAIENIVSTIREGRPNGMPSFQGRIPDDQIWQIAAYVRSMSRAVRKDVAPGRSDSMNAGKAESRRPFHDPAPTPARGP